ncbi:selenium metabolism protein YedF [Caminicella sporogenes DSM 14501]|uniref:Selenium metabolism protein YedF n=1 Tax=Caminicella sporogenes DSM 14501 TaxID=1121266 RepID=A0A1M6NFA4_9FIRM|nr:sulfurtransferase-like selenium metabolism protein YedF [Caminicella sporogenes]RKD22222.1 SirA family protein [Caminicella sporogenes]WIF95845.1 sulfurtransferase-like selenium metabolism protein YedF [Caminicella sporogenes]SHJ94266.1 selenium metabolism protein YedF [Caminicella sporogenes DSM 14501]
MKLEVDARGMQCPKPVIETKKAMEKINEGTIITIVDNEVAKENVTKLAKSLNCEVEVKEINGDFYVSIYKGMVHEEYVPEDKTDTKDLVLLIGKDIMGDGSEELGKVLMKGYFYTLTEIKPYPKAILFVNSGVKLTTEGSEVIDHIRKLESEGVEILSCGTCLDYFNLKDKLVVGGVTNMYTIVEKMSEAKNTITL